MDSKRLGTLAAMIAFAVVLAWLPAAPAHAQHGRQTPTNVVDGEPTDPDGIIPTFSEEQLKVGETYGLTAPEPDDADAQLTWFEALLELLRSLGLIPAEEGKK